MVDIVGFEDGERVISWPALTDALIAGHALPRAEVGDTFLYNQNNTLLSRAAWIEGLGQAVKTATIFPDNAAQNRPTINGAVLLFSDITGELEAQLDFHLVTKWKTAGDSLLAAKYLAPPDARNILLVGAGTVARSMIDAYSNAFPTAQFKIWSRSGDSATSLADEVGATPVSDLAAAVSEADIICTATMSKTPVLQGEWLSAGTHLDLIGAFRPDMREVDDTALTRARVFVDSYDTTLDHIGELKIPLEQGLIRREDVVADFYDLKRFKRMPDDITICKNGGGAHLDLMTCRVIYEAWKATQ